MKLPRLFAIVVAASTVPAIACGAPKTFDEVVIAHRESVTRLHTLMLDVSTSSNVPNAETEYRWTWKGKQERCSLRFPMEGAMEGEFTGNSFRLGFKDAYNGPDGYRLTSNIDPSEPLDQVQIVDHPADGQIGDYYPLSKFVLANVRGELGLTLEDAPQQHYPLWELVAHATKKKLVSTPSPDGTGDYQLRIETPSAVHQVSVTPRNSHLIRETKTQRKNSGIHFTKVVDAFHSVDNGLSVPARVSTQIFDRLDDDQPIETTATVKVVVANDTLPADAFDVPMPQGLVVFDRVKDRIHVWGADGPQQTFSTQEEYVAWDTKRKTRFMDEKPAIPRAWLALGVLFTVSAVVAVQRVRRK